MTDIPLNDVDRWINQHEIQPWLPPRIFDLHAHLFPARCLPDFAPLPGSLHDGEVNMATMRAWWAALFPAAAVHGLLLPFPTPQADWRGQNAFLAAQVTDPTDRCAIQAGPICTTAELAAAVRQYRPFALKPYLCYARGVDPQAAGILDFMPEEQIALADEHGLAVMLHVSKARGMADDDNLAAINRLVKDYPRCHFILAHCGRCFIPVNMEDALPRLPVAENLWFDTSAVADVGVFLHLLNGYERRRICFGTDLVQAVGFRGQYVRLGLSWNYVTDRQLTAPGGRPPRATLAAYENLRALLLAARFSGFREDDYQNLFYDNAAELCRLDH